MGTQYKRSSDRAIARVSLPRQDRDTMVFCPACQGNRSILTELPDGRYKTRICRWCNATGSVDKQMFAIYNRWLRIYNHNKVRGLCKNKT